MDLSSPHYPICGVPYGPSSSLRWKPAGKPAGGFKVKSWKPIGGFPGQKLETRQLSDFKKPKTRRQVLTFGGF